MIYHINCTENTQYSGHDINKLKLELYFLTDESESIGVFKICTGLNISDKLCFFSIDQLIFQDKNLTYIRSVTLPNYATFF